MEEIRTLSTRSSELCFKKDEFMASDFSLDKFVIECRKNTALETIKEDLGLFLKVLQTAVVELINKDYGDFLNLSTNLVGLDKSIKNLSAPLLEVKGQISSVLSKLEQVLSVLQNGLKKRNVILENKVLLHHVMCILESIENIQKQNLVPVLQDGVPLSPEVIERIAVEYSRIQFHSYQNSSMDVIWDKQAVVNDISNCLSQHLEALFVKSVTDSNTENLSRVLRIYSTIDRIHDAENIFRVKIARPYMRKAIDEDFIAKNGIDQMYDIVLDFVPQKCSAVLEITRGGKKNVKGYDFLVSSVWPEIILCLEYIASAIFAPGNPEVFHKNYMTSLSFVEKFEHLCVVQSSVQRLREHPLYKSFMDKWNLSVYFEIRFQEIGGFVENALTVPFLRENTNNPFFINATAAVWQGMNHCWNASVYIQPLCHRFWKLTLQLLSRYYFWVNSLLKVDKNQLLNSAEEPDQKETVTLVQLAMVVKDIELLISEVPLFYDTTIVPKLTIGSNITRDALLECLQLYKALPTKVGQVIVKELMEMCIQHLRPIKDIPRLYRKTNRDVPSKPSSYVSSVLMPLNTFITDTEFISLPEWKNKWTADVINCITEHCLSMTTDVLTSIKKMEDSLKRLKKAREKPLGQTVMGSMSDDDKIRRQLVIDVECFGKEIERYGDNSSNVNYKKLQDLVSSAVKTSAAL